MAWVQVSKIARRVSSYRNGVRGFRTEDQPTNAILYAEDVNPVYDHLDVLTDAVNLAGQTAVVGNEGLGAIGESPLARGSMLVRGESAYENMPPGNSLQVPHWNSNVPRGMEPVTLLPGPWERVTLSSVQYRHGDEWPGYNGTSPFASGNPRPALMWRWEGRDTVHVRGAVVDVYVSPAYGLTPEDPTRRVTEVGYVGTLPTSDCPVVFKCLATNITLVGITGKSTPNVASYRNEGTLTPDGRIYPYFLNSGGNQIGTAVYVDFTYTATQQRP